MNLSRRSFIEHSFFLASFLGCSIVCPAQIVTPPYEIGTWRGFRPAAISYTFDDDLTNQYAVAVPMFNAKGLRLTLFTVVNWLPNGSWAPVQNAALSGHEIASHTVSHPDISTLTGSAQTNELLNSQSAINAHVPGQKCVTLAYPYCAKGNDAITSQFYIASRNCSGQLVPRTPPNFQAISSYVCGVLGSVKTTADFNGTANNAAAANAWCVYLIHALDGESGYSPLPSSVLQGAVDYVSANSNRFWVETFGNVVRYIRERDASSVIETSNGADALRLQATNSLDPGTYDFPITLRRLLPANWLAAIATQNGALLETQVVNLGSTNYLMFDVRPNGGEVVVSRVPQPFALSDPVMARPTSFTVRLNGQIGVRYALCSSDDLLNWVPIRTNLLATASTNLTIAVSDTLKFYRAKWVP